MLTLIVDEKDFISDSKVEIIQKKDINHLKNVYRYKKGDYVRLIDGINEYLSQIDEIENKKISLNIIEKKEDNYSLSAKIDIALGVLKNDKMNMALQKLTEIGINKIIPLKTERVIVKLDDSKEKWKVIIEEALKQCRGVKIPEIDKITLLKNIEYLNYDKVFFAYENSCEDKSLFVLLTGEENNILYFIGLEGGFTKEEAETFLKELENSVIDDAVEKLL
mgnify:CR=1 FL=1